MNTRHYYLRLLRTFTLATLTAAATAACSDDTDNDREPLTPPDASDGIPVTFTANINPGSDADPADAPDTRTILTPDGGGFTVTWKGMSDFICIWAAMGNTLENNGNYKTYVPTTSAASSGLVPRDASNKLTLSSTGEWKFTAVYGESGAGNREADAVLSPLSQSEPNNTEHIAKADFSVATATKHVETGDMPDINLRFKHKLSALQLRVTNQTGEALTIKEIRLSADGGEITTKKVYDVAQGKWQTTGEEKAAYLKLTASNFPALPSGGTESQDFHMLLFPGYENDTLTVTVITSRGEYSRTRPAPDGGFLAGKNYLTDITLRTDGLTAEEKWVQYISNKAELIAFRERVNNGIDKGKLNARLLTNIDLTGEAWTPIGNSSNKFKGTFDGGGYRISNLSVDNGSNDNAGLFGYITGGTVRNLRVSGTVTTTGKYAGGIAGQLINSCTVENCLFGGTVSGGNQAGGIAGNIFGGSSRVAGCHTKGSVTATTSQNAGGIVGINSHGTITDCYSEAEVTTSNQSAGGIAGSNYSSLIHCYATGKVSGKTSVGGIVGSQSGGTLTGCIALNPGLTRTADSRTEFGRIVGYNYDSTPTSCAAYEGMTIKDVNTTDFYAAATGEHGTALPAADCLAKDTYTTTLGFTEPTATTPGWAFDATAPWQYLPWNKAFKKFPGITDPAQYRIKVPTHLNGGGSVN